MEAQKITRKGERVLFPLLEALSNLFLLAKGGFQHIRRPAI